MDEEQAEFLPFMKEAMKTEKFWYWGNENSGKGNINQVTPGFGKREYVLWQLDMRLDVQCYTLSMGRSSYPLVRGRFTLEGT